MQRLPQFLSVVLMILCACGAGGPRRSLAEGHATPIPQMELKTSAFAKGGFIPARFTCKGLDVSPALAWSGVPAKTHAFALILEDPDAPGGTWTHWLVYDLPATARLIPEDLPKTGEIPGGGWQGVNDFGKIGYGGPCPPPGKPHRYFFRLYALNAPLELNAAASKQQVRDALQGHVAAETELMGRFKH